MILGGAAVAGGLLIINALKDKRVADLNVPSGGTSNDNDLLRDNYNAAQKMIVDLKGKVASGTKTEGQLRNVIKAKSGSISKLTSERDLLKDNYGAAQNLLADAKNVTLSSIPDMYRNQF